MGDYLLLQWLGTRRGLAVFVLLVLVTVFSNLCRFSERDRTKQIQSPAKVELKRLAQFGRPKPKQLPVLCQVAGLDRASSSYSQLCNSYK
jgi:hypothetical protein